MDLSTVLPRTPKILVADDDMFNRDLLKAYLTNAGCEVISTVNGEDAWQNIVKHKPDLALLDIQMPLLDGLGLCQRIKSDPRFQFMPVVIVTAMDAENDRLRSIQAGADEFIGKPFNSIILITRVRSLLRLKWMHDELEDRNHLLRQVLNRYVDPEITSTILANPEKYMKLGGETRQITILFADLRGFTRFTEQHSVSDVVETLNLIFTELTEVVFHHGGTFDKFLGDAVMAFFGAPLMEEDDALRAMRAALEMQKRFAQLQTLVSAELIFELGLGIGLHSGEAIVGNIGSEHMMDYTAIGDTVNIARRLQEAARPGETLISHDTYNLVPQSQARRLETRHLPGRKEPIDVYTLLALEEYKN